MRSPRPLRLDPSAVLYRLAAVLAGLLVCTTALHDERLALERQCANYASPAACRVF